MASLYFLDVHGVENLMTWWRVEGTTPMLWIEGRPIIISKDKADSVTMNFLDMLSLST